MSTKSNQTAVQNTFDVTVEMLGRDRATIRLSDDGGGKVSIVEMKASGCSQFLKAMGDWRAAVEHSHSFPVAPSGSDHISILMRELDMRTRGAFELPYKEEELCHCRAVPTQVVDRAIIAGCHSVASVARMTSAGTSCGTCKPDTESLIKFRLAK